ncbi:hypothetical protein CHARACLAT_032336 [Characodon lateralis]|uniref:Uncharacterized protein n=1 Tax=Characodon lateralis TaxID=208331 RepID=A0ABU7EZ21_9TELE|nr:hypothetical protein [Characodon lateralis]
MTNTAGNMPADPWMMTCPQNQSWFAPLQPLSTSSVQSRKCLASLQSQLALRLPAASKNIRLPSDSGRAQQLEELDNHTVAEPDKPVIPIFFQLGWRWGVLLGTNGYPAFYLPSSPAFSKYTFDFFL